MLYNFYNKFDKERNFWGGLRMEGFRSFLIEEGKATSTIKSYLSIITAFQTWWSNTVGKEFDPSSVTGVDLQDYKQYLTRIAKNLNGNRLSPRTINKKLEAIKTYFRYLDETNLISFNPSNKLKQHKIQGQDDPPRWLDRNEKNRLLRMYPIIKNYEWRNIKNHWKFTRNRAIVYLMLYTGLRVSEVVGLELNDIDLERGILEIREGKGGKWRRLPISQIKELNIALKEWLEHRESQENNRLFISERKVPLTVQGIEHLFRNIRKETGIEDITPHTLRHTCFHDLLEKGYSLPVVKDIAEHENIQTTYLYTKSSEEERSKALGSLSSFETKI